MHPCGGRVHALLSNIFSQLTHNSSSVYFLCFQCYFFQCIVVGSFCGTSFCFSYNVTGMRTNTRKHVRRIKLKKCIVIPTTSSSPDSSAYSLTSQLPSSSVLFFKNCICFCCHKISLGLCLMIFYLFSPLFAPPPTPPSRTSNPPRRIPTEIW